MPSETLGAMIAIWPERAIANGNEKFTSKRLRRLKGDELVATADEKRVKKMMGI